ncbi:MAG: type II 3-dehydroquinate dehydratase [Nitrospinae bacterium]|nr:type II 3-dehydroquinate dehydratase [Nitrospinota bacterium]
MRILLLNGPNLNLLGMREPEVYGETTLAELESALAGMAADEGAEIECFQSNVEGELIDALQRAAGVKPPLRGIAPSGECAACIFNPGGYTHTSVALRDAIGGLELPVYEVHISNVLKREGFRHRSLIGPVAAGSVIGFGMVGYALALRAAINIHVKGLTFPLEEE